MYAATNNIKTCVLMILLVDSLTQNGTGLCTPGEDGEIGAACPRETGHVEVAIFEQHRCVRGQGALFSLFIFCCICASPPCSLQSKCDDVDTPINLGDGSSLGTD